MYEYDALSRVKRIRRTTLAFPVPTNSDSVLDVISFAYDSVTLSAGKAWCSRLLSMTDPMGGVTRTEYGPSGVASCLPVRTIGLAADTTTFGYGSLTADVPSAARPTSVRDPNGLGGSVTYDATTWNTKTHTRLGDGALTTMFLNPRGWADSVADPMGIVTRYRHDRSGRVTHQWTGTGPEAPATETTYDAGGLVTRVDVYAPLLEDIDLRAQPDSVQSTFYYYDRLGQVDSVVGPGSLNGQRPIHASGFQARKQEYIRDGFGNPLYEYTGNGSYIARQSDWQGRLRFMTYSLVDPTRSIDGERFADPESLDEFNALYPTNGKTLSNGQQYTYGYDEKGQRIYVQNRDVFLDATLTTRWWDYSAAGLVVQDHLHLSHGADIYRRYQYNRRGQRISATDSIIVADGSGLNGHPFGETRYYYNTATARLDSLVSRSAVTREIWGLPFTVENHIATVTWQYDRGGRDTLRVLRLGGDTTDSLMTRRQYDVVGRPKLLQTRRGSTTWYEFGTTASGYTKAGDLLEANEQRPDGSGALHYLYSNDGTRRLIQSQRTSGGASPSHTWQYDVFGNRREQSATGGCGSTVSSYWPDNRLTRTAGCLASSTFRYDQVGNRLSQQDTLANGPVPFPEITTYTAANQLYFSQTHTASAGTYDFNWHWYDGDGMRVVTKFDNNCVATECPDADPRNASGTWMYYVYDGSDVALTLARGPSGWQVYQRYVVGGVDEPLAGRFAGQNLALIADHQGTTLAAVQPNGMREESAYYYSRNPFGAMEGTLGGAGTVNTGTGFTGASTPNQTGGYTYLRNRWYDPQTGRFLTQDPIGLAGGVNLYAYAGNNPVTFTDPFGLKADTVEINSEALRKTVETKRKDPVFDSLYTALHNDPRTFRLIGTDVAPDHVLNDRAARFTGKTFAPGASWAGFDVYQSFTAATDAGVALIGMNGPHPGETTGHEMGHLIQIKDGLPFSHNDALMQRLIPHFGY